ERYGDVQVSIEAIALVEAADLEKDLAPCCRAVPLDGFRFAARDLVEVLEVCRAKTPRSRESDGRIVERTGERTEEIARDLDRAVHHEEQAASRHTYERVTGRPLAEITICEVRLHARIARRDVCDPVLRVIARARIENEDFTIRGEKGEHAQKTAREVGRVLARHDADRPGSRRWFAPAIGKLLRGRDRSPLARRDAAIAARDHGAIGRLIVDPIAGEGPPQAVGALEIAGSPRRAVLFDG